MEIEPNCCLRAWNTKVLKLTEFIPCIKLALWVYEVTLVAVLAVGEESAGHAGVVERAGVTVLTVGPETTSFRQAT